jgi:hypothetical protein
MHCPSVSNDSRVVPISGDYIYEETLVAFVNISHFFQQQKIETVRARSCVCRQPQTMVRKQCQYVVSTLSFKKVSYITLFYSTMNDFLGSIHVLSTMLEPNCSYLECISIPRWYECWQFIGGG